MAKTSRQPKPEIIEVASIEKDLDLFSGWLGRIENPDDVLRQESAGRGVRLYEDLSRDWQVFSMLQTRTLGLKACEWQIEPASESSEDVAISDFVQEVLKKANFDRLCEDFMQAVITGYKPVEIMWEVSEGDVWVKEFRGRRPSRFIFDTDYKLRLLTLRNPWEGEIVPDRKFITWSFGGYDFNPYGRGLGYQLYWPVWFRKNGIKYWMVFSEQFGSPTALGKYPPGSSEKDKEALLDAISAIRQQTGIRIPDTMAIELLEASRAGNSTYEALCEYFDKCIAKVILGQTLTSDQGDRGSQSLGNVHERVKDDILKADADGQCELINGTLVKWLVDYNFPLKGQRVYPRVWRRTEPEQNLKALAERDKILLVDMGMGKRVPETYIQDTYGIPLAEGQEAVITKPEPEPKVIPGQMPKQAQQFSEDGRLILGQLAVDGISNAAVGLSTRALDAMLSPIIELIMSAQSMEEIGEQLYELYPRMDASRFQELLARALFVSGLTGYASSESENA